MPRPPRLLLSHSYYHIMIRGNNKKTVFKKEGDYYYFLHLIAKYKEELPFDLFHYSLMPNHVHQLVKTQRAEDFSLYMKKLELAYFHYYRQYYGWVGHFWQDRFRSQPVGKDEYFIQCGKYIELNSTRKKLVANPGDYKFSSYRHYSQGIADPLITDDFYYLELSENPKDRQEKYQKIVIEDLILSTYSKKIWGSPSERYNEKRKIQHNLLP